MKYTKEQTLRLTILYSQQTCLNNILIEAQKKSIADNKIEMTAKEMLTYLQDSFNEAQYNIDTEIKQIENDVQAELN